MALDAHVHNYEVFLSFRGDDTRESFTDHLYAALCHHKLIPFRDEEELERGEVIKPSLLQAIEGSLSAIVVLSENYANSSWCLDELLKILDSKKELGLHVFPIFYRVDPSDVRHQRGSFAEAFEKLERKFADDKVQRWRAALKEVADIAGWNSQDYRHESKLIEDVVEKVWSKLDDQQSLGSNDEGVVKTHNKLVGIDEKIQEFKSLFLEDTLEQAQFIGIWGMGGLGKTTLARAVYERIGKNYDVSFFLQNVRERSATDDGLIKLQEKLLSHLNRRIGREVTDCYEGRKLIKRRLHNRKVLLVLDDVSQISQLENLAGEEGWFCKGSTIIITTRDKHLLVEHGVDSRYEMNLLSPVESLQLFRQKAFKGNETDEDYLELSKMAIESAQGLPLALKVFGSFLCGRSKSEWEDALKKIPSSAGIFDILKVSFDGLEDNEKNIFLDIACFFNGMAEKNVKQMLENIGLQAKIGIQVLIEKSLVTKREGCLWVHDLLQEMGKKIVFLESPNDAGKRSRICSAEDATHVLGNKRGTEEVRGIALRLDKQYVIHLDPEAFSSITNLKLLIISSHSHDQLNFLHGLNCLSNTLKVLEWEWYPLDFLPSQTQFHELVDLKMQHSKLKELWRDQFLRSLKFINLSHSTNLIRTPNFETTPNLQNIILEGCTKLVEVHHSLGQHKNLIMVDLKGCKSIKTLPPKLEMNCLETFVLSGCSKVKKLPEFGEVMEHLFMLNLKGTAISKLPQSLVNLRGLATLKLKNCKNLVCLPENLHENEALEELDVCGTAIKEVPSSLNNLKVLSLGGCKGYAQSSSSGNHYCSLLKRAFRFQRHSTSTLFQWSPFSYLSSLVLLDLRYCNLHDESLSSEIGKLSSLTALDLTGSNFVEFPSSLFSKLRKLESIRLNDCPRLQSLPLQLPSNLSYLGAADCPSLKQYVCSQQLWEFIEQFESQTRILQSEILDYHESLTGHILSNYVSGIVTRDSQAPDDFFMQPTRILNLPGSEVPSWFHNQSYFCAEDLPFEYPPSNVSFIVKKQDSCSSSEWWGIAVCLVLENDLESTKSDDDEYLYWTYRDSKGEYSNSFRCNWSHSSCRHQLHIIHIRFSSFVGEQLQMAFFTSNEDFEIRKCGWRVVCEQDVERWRNTGDEGCIVEDEAISDVEPSPL